MHVCMCIYMYTLFDVTELTGPILWALWSPGDSLEVFFKVSAQKLLHMLVMVSEHAMESVFLELPRGSKLFQHGLRMMYAGFPCFLGLELEDPHVPTFWVLL